MNIIVFEDRGYLGLLPLTWLRASCELRCGCDRLLDRFRAHAGNVVRALLRPALQNVVEPRLRLDPVDSNTGWAVLNARALLTNNVVRPPPGVGWQIDGELVAAGVRAEEAAALTPGLFLDAAALHDWMSRLRFDVPRATVCVIRYPWDLIAANPREIRRQCRAGGVHEGTVDAGAHLLQPAQIHLGRGARVKPGAVLDAEDGPIHISEQVLVEPNAVIQGPCYLGPRCVVRPGASLRAGTSIGPVCKVGGEIEASILQGYSNKQHDGFLGHSFVAEWVNLGADTVTSDLKNTYGAIRVALSGVPAESGQHFLGSIIGDHSKTGIGTILPTGCVIGAAANVFTQGPVPKFVPSFAWLTDEGLTSYRVAKALEIARTAMGRREIELSDAEARLLEHVAAEARQAEAAGWM